MAEWSTERLTEWLNQCLTELLIEWFTAIEVSVSSARSLTNAIFGIDFDVSSRLAVSRLEIIDADKQDRFVYC